MTTAYSTNLELALPVQGELSGTWGDTVNNGITQYLDTAIAGSQIISGSQTAVTLSNTNGDASATNIAQVGSGSTGTAQYQIIRCTGNPASLLTITVSDTTTVGYSKTFVIINATSTSQSVKIVGSGPTTGVTVLSGAKSLVAWNGSDFVEIASSTADGVTTFSAGTTGFTPSTATSGAVTLAGTLATTNGGTGLTSFTANGVVYASSTSALATGSSLVFDGTNLGIGTSSPNTKLQVNGNAVIGNGTVGAPASGYQLRITNDNSDYYDFGRSSSTGYFTINASQASPYRGFIWAYGGTSQMTLDSSGNLGLGVTPVTWYSAYKAQQIGTVGVLYDTGNSLRTGSNHYDDAAGNTKYLANGYAQRIIYNSSNGATIWAIAGNNTSGAGAACTFSTAMTLDASGNLMVGTTTSNSAKLTIANAGAEVFQFFPGITSNENQTLHYNRSTSVYCTSSVYAADHRFNIQGNEKVRIDSSGNLLVGTTTAAAKLTIASTTNPALTLPNIAEIATISATAATGTINYDATTQSVLYYTTNASGNFTMNVRGNSGLSLNSMMSTGQSLTVAFLCTNGGTAYYQTGFQIDGSSVTPKWQGGTAPSSGNTSSIDVYTYAIIKTGSATFTVLASQTQFK